MSTFKEMDGCVVKGARWFTNGVVRVIVSTIQVDMVYYLHVSASCARRVPTYTEMKLVKVFFVGDHVDAVEHYPRTSEHVDDHPHVRHLWSRVDAERMLPDMRQFEPAYGKLSI